MQIADDAFLRLLDEADGGELHRLIEANRAHLARWLPWAGGQTLDDTLDFIRGTRSQLSDNNGFQAAVVIKESIVGVIGYATGATALGLAAAAAGVLAAFLNGVFGLCLGCEMYLLIRRIWPGRAMTGVGRI